MNTAPISLKIARLLKGLSPTELRYCRCYLGIHQAKDSGYLRLFNALLAQEIPDEQTLAIIVYGPKGKPSSAFSELKKYLYKLLLSALHSYDEKSTPGMQIDRQLQNAKVLFKRGRYLESKTIIHKVKKKAKSYEDWFRLLEVLQLEQKETDKLEADIPLDSLKETVGCLEVLDNLTGFKNLYYHLIISVRTHALLREEEKKEKLKKLLDVPFFQKKEWKSKGAELFYFWIGGLYAYSVLDYPKFYTDSKIAFNLVEKKYKKTKTNSEEYIRILGNLLLSLGLLDKIDEIELLTQKYLAVKPSSSKEKENCFVSYNFFRNSVILKKGIFKTNYSFIKIQEKEIEKFDLSNTSKILFLFQYFYFHFALEKYSDALNYLDQYIALLNKLTRKDRQYLYPCYQLMIHFELKNYQLLESLSRSLYRNLKKEKRLFGFEKCLLHFIGKARKAVDRQALQETFIWLSAEFKQLEKNPSEAIIFKYFPINLWVESKITNRPFAEIIAEEYQRKN